MQARSDFSTSISNKKVLIDNVEKKGKYYLFYQHARCSLLESPEKADAIWSWCKVKYNQENLSNADTAQIFVGYIDALIEEETIQLGDFFAKAEEAYGKEGVFSNMTSTFKNQFVASVKKLVEQRQDEISEETKNLWQNR